ncbi:MAG TPA: hypothetical protein VGD36_17460 [Xanthobacteraceae bacterium]|jgi:hypothetical protein
MKKLALAALSVAAILTSAGAASAQGFYFGIEPRQHYEPRRYYEPQPYYAPRYQAPSPYYGGGGRRGYDGYQRRSACAPGWSVQDGVCKPYRGY